jgi:hypothetical protein
LGSASADQKLYKFSSIQLTFGQQGKNKEINTEKITEEE